MVGDETAARQILHLIDAREILAHGFQFGFSGHIEANPFRDEAAQIGVILVREFSARPMRAMREISGKA